jgi:hypothetical protein
MAVLGVIGLAAASQTYSALLDPGSTGATKVASDPAKRSSSSSLSGGPPGSLTVKRIWAP